MLTECSVGVALNARGIVIECLLKFPFALKVVALSGVTVCIGDKFQTVSETFHSVSNSITRNDGYALRVVF